MTVRRPFRPIEYPKAAYARRLILAAALLVMLAAVFGGCGRRDAPVKESSLPAGGESGAQEVSEKPRGQGGSGGESGVEAPGAKEASEKPQDQSSPRAGGEAAEVPGAGSRTALSPGAAGYEAPDLTPSAFHEDQAKGENGVLIDLSRASDGYVAVRAQTGAKMKFQVIKDGFTYTYDLRSDGIPAVFPLQMQDGMYSFRAVENISGTKYAVVCTAEATISIKDEFCPFLCSNEYVNYTQDSLCVKKARELAASAQDANGVINGVYDYICAGVKYDRQKAQSVQTGYLPDPDETLSTGKGICFDYASLAGAMLRSQGIPCKVIFGYVSPDDLYHAWNMFYTEKDGWVTVNFEVSGKKWNRLDLTFSANGADGNFIGDGSNYKEVYCY